MKTLFETHKQLKDDYLEYKQTHPKITFNSFLIDVLNYSQEESKEIIKAHKNILFKK